MKVYCKDCKYLMYETNVKYSYTNVVGHCGHPDRIEVVSTALSFTKSGPPIEKVNTYNDCKLFEPNKSLWYKIKKCLKGE